MGGGNHQNFVTQQSGFHQESKRPIGDYFSIANVNEGENHESARHVAGTGNKRSYFGSSLRPGPDQPDRLPVAVGCRQSGNYGTGFTSYRPLGGLLQVAALSGCGL
jgi:hypothetical protein